MYKEINPGDGPPHTSPSWGQHNEPEITLPSGQLPQQLPQGDHSQPQMYNSGHSVVHSSNALPFQLQGHQQLSQQQQQQQQQPIASWQDGRDSMGKTDAVPVSVPSTEGQVSFSSYMDPSAGDPRVVVPVHPNYQHAQEPMRSSFSHPNPNAPREQRLSSNPSIAPHIGHPISHHGSMSSVTESPLGTSFSGPPNPVLNYVPGGQGHYQSQYSSFARQALPQNQNVPPQVPQNIMPMQGTQHRFPQPPQGHFPNPQQQFLGQQQLPSSTELQAQQAYQYPQQAHHMVPMFNSQQRSQVVMQPGSTTPFHQHQLQQQYPTQTQFTPDNGASSSNFSAPLPPQSMWVDNRGETYVAPRSHSTPSQPVSFDLPRSVSSSNTTHSTTDHSYSSQTRNVTLGSSAPLSSGFAPSVIGVPQPLSGNYFPHGPPPHATTPPYSTQPQLPSLSPSPKSKNLKLDAAPQSPVITRRTRKSKIKSAIGGAGSDTEVYEDPYEQDRNSASSKGRRLRCFICGRSISRDMSRHMRIHEDVSRFCCIYPRDCCSHKTGYFNRQYDFKKHLLHYHFNFQDPGAKKYNSLSEKLPFEGTCDCGANMPASTWLSSHIMNSDSKGRYLCPDLREKWDDYNRRNHKVLYRSHRVVDPQTREERPLGGNMRSASTNTASANTTHKLPEDHH